MKLFMQFSKKRKWALPFVCFLILTVLQLLISGSAAAEKPSFNLFFHPAGFLDGASFSVAEDLMGTLLLISESSKNYQDCEAILTLEYPGFMRLEGVYAAMAMADQEQRRNYAEGKIRQLQDFIRDGQRYQLREIVFSERFSRLFGSGWYHHHLFFQMEKGSAGRTGTIKWQMRMGNESHPGGEFPVKVVNPLSYPETPCREFQLLVTAPTVERSPLREEFKDIMNSFWSRLAQRPHKILFGGDRCSPAYRNILMLYGMDCQVAIDDVQQALTELKRHMPMDEDERGRPGREISAWCKVDDPQQLYENYLRQAFKEILRHYPEVEGVVVDYEPGPNGYDEGGRRRFAAAMQLDKVPSVAEINTLYARQWFCYMVHLHAILIEKVAKIFHQEAPGKQFWLCSDNLHAGPQPVSSWCGVDVRLSDDVIDGHMHMPYYAGVQYFDDVKVNVDSLRKPFLPMINPGEPSRVYFRRYSVPKIIQNIVATAALGAAGIGFWPGDYFPAEYFQAVATSFSSISRFEGFYRQGSKNDAAWQICPVNVLRKDTVNQDGEKITLEFPNFHPVLRHTIHNWQDEDLFTLFNYDTSQSIIVEILGENQRLLAEIPPEGVLTFLRSAPPEQKILQQKLDAFLANNPTGAEQRLQEGDCVLDWSADAKGAPVFMVGNASIRIALDLLGDASLTSIRNQAGNELLHKGFAGKLIFYDLLQERISFTVQEQKIEDAQPEIVLTGTVPGYAGANPVENPLSGLQVGKRIRLRGKVIELEHTFNNPGDRAMVFGFRINNYPFPGHYFGSRNLSASLSSGGRLVESDPRHELFVRPGMQIPFMPSLPKHPWDGGAITVSARHEQLSEIISFAAPSDFAGVYCSWSGGTEPARTVEFLSEQILLKPGETCSFRYDIVTE